MRGTHGWTRHSTQVDLSRPIDPWRRCPCACRSASRRPWSMSARAAGRSWRRSGRAGPSTSSASAGPTGELASTAAGMPLRGERKFVARRFPSLSRLIPILCPLALHYGPSHFLYPLLSLGQLLILSYSRMYFSAEGASQPREKIRRKRRIYRGPTRYFPKLLDRCR